MKIVAGMPSCCAASATPCAWLPAEAATTPRARSARVSRESRWDAPRILNEPVRCRFSSLRKTGTPSRSVRCWDLSSGVWLMTPAGRPRHPRSPRSVGSHRVSSAGRAGNGAPDQVLGRRPRPGAPRPGGERHRDDVDERRQRHREEGARDAGDHRAARDDEHDREGVHLDGGAHQERLQHVALELLHAEHDDEHPEGDPRPVVDQGEEDGEGAGHDRADDRHEGAEEDQHRDRDGEGHAEQERAEPDADGVDRGDEQLGARVVDDGDPAVARGAVDGGARGAREQPHRPAPDPGAVGEDAQEDEQGQQRPDETWPSVVPNASAPDQSSSACCWMSASPARAGRRSARA